MVRVEIKEVVDNKVKYIHVRTPNDKATGLMAMGNIKFLIEGVPNVTITKGSYKFG